MHSTVPRDRGDDVLGPGPDLGCAFGAIAGPRPCGAPAVRPCEHGHRSFVHVPLRNAKQGMLRFSSSVRCGLRGGLAVSCDDDAGEEDGSGGVADRCPCFPLPLPFRCLDGLAERDDADAGTA